MEIKQNIMFFWTGAYKLARSGLFLQGTPLGPGSGQGSGVQTCSSSVRIPSTNMSSSATGDTSLEVT
jgi:hypothetical protein